MPPPREQMTLDPFRNNLDNPFRPPPSRGCLITKAKATFIFLAFLIIVAAVAIGTYHFTKEQLQEKEVLTPLANESDTGPSKKLLNIRLPDTIIPIYYKLELLPHLEPAKNFSLQGKVWIDVQCVKETSHITLHIKNLTILKETVIVSSVVESELPMTSSENDVKIEGHEFDEEREFYTIIFGSRLVSGAFYRIFIEYTGTVDDTLGGFYRSSYFDTDSNETRYIGATQFESTDARKAFPCFDEPALKAKFEVSIARRVNMTTISNMDLQRTETIPDMEGWVWDHYKKSLPMSTYLLAWVVSDFESRVSNRSLSKPEFRVWARKSAIQQTEYARDIGPRLLTFFENYFGTNYPLPKQDMIAIPDFAAGAMENWGLITFRESAMLVDKVRTSDDAKRFISLCTSHELSHQWFGNLVTPKWWNDLWLNEGFARYTEFIGVDYLSPDWKVLEYFVNEVVHEALTLDSLDSSHPISIPVYNPIEIHQIFDQITYRKGASIIRMMNHALTDDTYKEGLHNYFKKWSYMAVAQDDLWDSLTQQAHADGTLDPAITVAEVMNTWTLQKGFPVINVYRNYQDGFVTFTQRKFQLSPNTTKEQEYASYRWWVPISYASKSENARFHNTNPSLWLSKEESSLTTGNITVNESSWLIVNVQQTGFYRVNYDDKNWQLITTQLMNGPSAIHPVNRAQLLDDAFNLARAGVLDYRLVFNLALYLEEENEFLPWESFRMVIEHVGHMLSKSPIYGTFKAFVQELVEKQYKRVGMNENSTAKETFLMRQHRTNIVKLACEMDLKECVEKAVQLFARWMTNNTEPDKVNQIPTNLRRTVFCTAIKQGGLKEWNFLWERYLKSNVATERNVMLYGLGCSKEEWILNRYLSWMISEGSGIRKQDGAPLMKTVAVHNIGSYVTFQFIRENWMRMMKYFGSKLNSLSTIVQFVSIKMNTPIELAELEQFKVKYQGRLNIAARNVDQAIESVGENVRWMEENYKTISLWLEQEEGEKKKR